MSQLGPAAPPQLARARPAMLTLVMFLGCSLSRLRALLLLLLLLVLLLLLHTGPAGQLASTPGPAPAPPDRLAGSEETGTATKTLTAAPVNTSKPILRYRDYKRDQLCTFPDPQRNTSRRVRCGSRDFVSFARSRCKTRLGNQMSSYAAVLFFQQRYGLVPVMEPFQDHITALTRGERWLA